MNLKFHEIEKKHGRFIATNTNNCDSSFNLAEICPLSTAYYYKYVSVGQTVHCPVLKLGSTVNQTLIDGLT